jgi:hypothetical protein
MKVKGVIQGAKKTISPADWQVMLDGVTVTKQYVSFQPPAYEQLTCREQAPCTCMVSNAATSTNWS